MGMFARKMLQSNWEKVRIADRERIDTQQSVQGIMQIAAVPYIKDDDDAHTLNVYYPQNTTKAMPTIIDIHGGGWMYGNRDLNKNRNMFLASLGFSVVSLNYRLLPKTDLQGQIKDIFSALNWFGNNARKYHCDTNNVFLTGDSAGGHLAALAICCMQSEDLQNAYDVKPINFIIKAVALSHAMCDVYDLGLGKKGFIAGKVKKEMLHMMFGKHITSSPIYKKASITEVSQGLKFPPIMLISSEADELHGQSVKLLNCFQNASTYFWKKDDGNEKLTHVFHILYPHWPESEQTNIAMSTFFKDELKT